MHAFQESYQRLMTQINNCAATTAQNNTPITTILVTKNQDLEKIQLAINAGHREFGENYIQEAIPKILALQSTPLIWHFIGPIQRNKTSLIAKHFNWVHSLDRLVIAERLNETRSSLNLPALQCLIQINVSQETTKGGIAPADVLAFAASLQAYPFLKLRGIMVMPSPDASKIAEEFERSVECFKALQSNFAGIDTLSMGTSRDFELAISMGATHLRLGEAFFGARLKKIK